MRASRSQARERERGREREERRGIGRPGCLLLLTLGALALAPPAAAAAPDDIPFESLFRLADASAPPILVDLEVPTERVTARGFAAQTRVLFFGYIKQLVQGTWLDIYRLDHVAAADENGTAVYELDETFHGAAGWLAIDLDGGDAGFSSSAGRPLRLIDVDALRFRGPGNDDAPVQMRYEGRRLEVIWIRPGVGSWAREYRDGGDDDEDLVLDGGFTVPLVSLRPIGDTPPNRKLRDIRRGDVVLFFDTRNFEAALVEAVEGLR